MQYKYYWHAALLILLAGCNLNQGKTPPKTTPAPPPAATPVTGTPDTDTSTVGLIPLEDQYAYTQEQRCLIKQLYTRNDTALIDADYIQFYVGKAADSVATRRRDGEMEIDAEGDTTWRTLDDYYILNENKKIRTLALAKDVKFYRIFMHHNVYRKLASMDDLKQVVGGYEIFILTFNENKEVSEIKQQYLP
jgi:hypothetical protein